MKHLSSVARKKSSSARKKARASSNGVRVVFSKRQIEKRVLEIAGRLNRDYKGKTLHVVGILENSFMFMADLVRSLKVPTFCYFVKAEIHDTSSGAFAVREIMFTPRVDAAQKEILLVDGILQSGLTLDHLFRSMLGQGANSVRTAMLVEKTDERKVDVATDYVGFKVDSKTAGRFLVGYGLAYKNQYQNLPYIASLN